MLLDLWATIDTIQYGFLLKKLESYYGARGHVLEWLKFDLSGSKFKVKIKESFSDDHRLEIGVPQGFILLFIMY